jgi:hypothetical protein
VATRGISVGETGDAGDLPESLAAGDFGIEDQLEARVDAKGQEGRAG